MTHGGSTLHVDVRVGETLTVGDGLTISVEEKSGRRARLKFVFVAPTTVRRTEKDRREPMSAKDRDNLCRFE